MNDKIKEILNGKVGFVFNHKDRDEILDLITDLQQINKNLTNSLNKKVEEGIKLQQENERLKMSVKDTKENADAIIIELQEENKRLKVQLGENKSIEDTASSFFNSLTNVMGNFMETELDAFEKQNDELNVYKLRNEKAIEYIRKQTHDEDTGNYLGYTDLIDDEHLLNILQGSDKE